jgi:GntR family transcriptional repressor for pyruvate dehydrogenase complex
MTSDRRLSSVVVRTLIDEVTAGILPPGSRLPTEPQLCDRFGVSRATLREAMNSLQQRGVVRSEQGRGSFVNPTTEWSPLDPALLAARTSRPGDTPASWSLRLIEARRLVEAGAAEMAARRRTEADLAAMSQAMEEMVVAVEAGEFEDFVQADLAFHNAVLGASDNEFVTAMLTPISQLIWAGRSETSATPGAMSYAVEAHTTIFRAISAKRPQAARRAMETHVERTAEFVPEASKRKGD